MHRLAAPALLWLLAGCSSYHMVVPARFEDVPADAPTDQAVRAARELWERGHAKRALLSVERIIKAAPTHIDAQRLRQDILRRRGRLGLVLAEAATRLRERDEAGSEYLRGRVTPDPEEKLARFRRATERSPRSFWGWLGLAFVLRDRDPEAAVRLYRALVAASGGYPLPAIALAGVLRGQNRLGEALSVYQELRRHPLGKGRGDLGVAETLILQEHPEKAWAPLMKALELRPFDAGVQDLLQQFLARGLPLDRLHQVVDVLGRDPARIKAFARDDGAPVLATLLAKLGDAFGARAVLAAADPRQRRAPNVRRLWRDLLLRTGDVKAFLEDLRASFPSALLADERNELRGLWLELFKGPWMRAADPIARLEDARGLCGALMHAGLLEPSLRVASIALWRHADAPGSEGLRALRDEVRRELAFERSVRRVLYHGYVPAAPKTTLRNTLAQLRRISLEILGRDVVGKPELFHLPVVGDLLDSFAPGLGRHFAAYNRHLVLGQRSGLPVEGMLLTRLCLRTLENVSELPLPSPCREVIGENREIRSFSGLHGGDLAGVALVNHYVIDMDSVVDWAHDILERREVVRADGGALLQDPVPDAAALQPIDALWRLSVMSSVEDSDLTMAVLDMIRWHERAHLVDFFYYLPVESHLWRVLGLLIGHGFSPSSIEAEIEARAETAALAMGARPRLVLAHIAAFLQVDGSVSAHALGFRRLARRIESRRRHRDRAPGVRHWHRLDPEEARRIGKELLAELW